MIREKSNDRERERAGEKMRVRGREFRWFCRGGKRVEKGSGAVSSYAKNYWLVSIGSPRQYYRITVTQGHRNRETEAGPRAPLVAGHS